MAQEAKLTQQTVREMAQLVGMSIPQERLQQVTDLYNSLLPAISEMMSLDLGDVEPAPIFRHRQGA